MLICKRVTVLVWRGPMCVAFLKNKLQGVTKGEQSETEKKINTCHVQLK